MASLPYPRSLSFSSLCCTFLYTHAALIHPLLLSASTDADVRTDRRRRPHRPTQMSAPTGADVRIDRRRCPYRPTQVSASTDADDKNRDLKQKRELFDTSNNYLFCGAGGIRTHVQTGKPYAFYMLILAFGFRDATRPRPPIAPLSSKTSPVRRGTHWLFPIYLHRLTLRFGTTSLERCLVPPNLVAE